MEAGCQILKSQEVTRVVYQGEILLEAVKDRRSGGLFHISLCKGQALHAMTLMEAHECLGHAHKETIIEAVNNRINPRLLPSPPSGTTCG